MAHDRKYRRRQTDAALLNGRHSPPPSRAICVRPVEFVIQGNRICPQCLIRHGSPSRAMTGRLA
jgi:hypothetical protein